MVSNGVLLGCFAGPVFAMFKNVIYASEIDTGPTCLVNGGNAAV